MGEKINAGYVRLGLSLIGFVLGAIAGYLYYYNVGCENGTCLITSSPVISTLYGALLGGLTASLLKK